MSTLAEELEMAAVRASIKSEQDARMAGARWKRLREIHLAEAARLRARAERARSFPALLSGELQIPGVTTTGEMFEWLTGPLDTP